MNIAYIILTHSNPNQTSRLVNRMRNSEDHIFIHVDVKVDLEAFSQSITEIDDTIHFVKKREDGLWGNLGIVKGTINALKEIIDHPIDFKQVVLLSGSDYPLKSSQQIHDFFIENLTKNFIANTPFPVDHLRNGGMNRISNYSINMFGKRQTYHAKNDRPKFSLKGKILNTSLSIFEMFKPKRVLPNGMNPFYGSQWWSMTGDTAKKVFDFIRNAPEYTEYHYYSLLPDEMFFQTIIRNIDLSDEIVDENKRLILWSGKSSHPVLLNEDHWGEITSTDALFGRKFAENSTILDKIDSNLLHLRSEKTF